MLRPKRSQSGNHRPRLHPFQNRRGADGFRGEGPEEPPKALIRAASGHLLMQNALSAGQTLSRAAAKTPPEEQSLQAGEPRFTMLGFLHFMLSYSPLSPSFHSLASKRASKGRVTLPHPLFAKHAAFPPPPGSTVFFHLQTPNLSHLGPNSIAPYLLTPRPRLRQQEAPGRVPAVLAAACFDCASPRRPPSRLRSLGGVWFILSQSGHNSGAVVCWTSFYQQTSGSVGVYLSFFWVVSVLRTVVVQFSSQK